jgi:branched-subunit amino acid ABC-type transport system permease component
MIGPPRRGDDCWPVRVEGMSLTLEILLSGLAAGSVYGLIAIGYVVVYRLTGIVYFALGELAALGVFVALLLAVGRGPATAETDSSGRFAIALVVAVVLVGAVGAASYFAVIHPYLVRQSAAYTSAQSVSTKGGVFTITAPVLCLGSPARQPR